MKIKQYPKPITELGETPYNKRIPQGEKWIETWAKNKGYTITRGTQQTKQNKGTPDYYIKETNTYIEEKKTLKNKLTPHQLTKCLQLQQQGHNISIAIRDTGAIIPLQNYLQTTNYTKKTWKKILTNMTHTPILT